MLLIVACQCTSGTMAVVKIAIKEGYFQPMTFLKMLSLVWLTMSDEVLRDEPLENLWGGGGREVQKNIRPREN